MEHCISVEAGVLDIHSSCLLWTILVYSNHEFITRSYCTKKYKENKRKPVTCKEPKQTHIKMYRKDRLYIMLLLRQRPIVNRKRTIFHLMRAGSLPSAQLSRLYLLQQPRQCPLKGAFAILCGHSVRRQLAS